MNNSLFYSLIMLVAGLGIPTMAALNGGLSTKLQSPALAASILFCVALLISITYLTVTEGIPSNMIAPNTPWYFYFGGFFVAFYVLSVTWVAPRFGVSNAISFVLLGQLIAMSTIDHFGLMGALQYRLNPQRVIGLLLMAAGVVLIVSTSQKA